MSITPTATISKQMNLFSKFALLAIALFGLALVPALPSNVGPGPTPAFAKKKKYKKRSRAPQSRKSDGPLLIVVSLGSQRIAVFDRNGQIAQSRISSGTRGRRTPTGVFSVLQKRRRHYSNLYAGASMPNMQRITWSGVAMHAGHLPGYPASHGCIRLHYSFSKWLFGMTELGTRVVVTNASPVPKRVSHPALLKPLPPERTIERRRPSSAALSRDRAANETSDGLFVTPAHAAEVPSDLEQQQIRTRESVAALRERELVKLENSFHEAKAYNLKMSDDLKRATVKLKSAEKELARAQTEARKLQQTIAKSDKAERGLIKRLHALLSSSSALVEPGRIEKAHTREEQIEAELLKHEAESEMAHKEARDLSPFVAARQAKVDTAKHRRDAIKRRLAQSAKQLTSAQLALTQAKAAAARRDKPITVLISRKKSMLFVRQGYEDVLRVAVDVANPEVPIGTHIFAALAYKNDETELEWHTVTAARSDVRKRRAPDRRRRRSRRRDRDDFDNRFRSGARSSQTPKNALDRIEIPDKVADRLAELIKPGSALIISDEGLSNETGKYTDIIVSTR